MGTTWRVAAAITGRLVFVGAVTCYVLARVFAGTVSPAETLVYGGTAAFGLEFLTAAWRALWQRG
ncbi:MAG: hypothetical protein ICV69_08725 [Thermoleophilaceae bacterium]|nr:hypothetical protein [Thermoleophilaceae bacterium]